MTLEKQELDQARPDIASTVLQILTEAGAQEHPMLMSTLGIKLTTALGGKPISAFFGSKKLRTVLEEVIGPLISFEGTSVNLSVRLRSQVADEGQPLRFDPAVWAAFSKPLGEGHRRFIRPVRRFDFKDFPEGEAPPEGWHEIEKDSIPDPSLPKPARDRAIVASINDWCQKIGYRPGDLLLKREPKPQPTSSADLENPRQGKSALLEFIKAAPRSEWKNLSLDFEVIFSYLSK